MPVSVPAALPSLQVYIGGRGISGLTITRGSAASPPTRTARVNVRAGETTVVIDVSDC